MAVQDPVAGPFQVFVRWRPLPASELPGTELQHSATQQDSKLSVSFSSSANPGRPETWKSGASYTHVFTAADDNSVVYEHVVAATLAHILKGVTCNFFAYGHSGSGKTHTIIGYDYERDQRLGLCLAAARDVFHALDRIIEFDMNRQADSKSRGEELGVAVRMYEVRGRYAYDLLNNGAECHVREGPDGRTHIRGQTEMLENGRVRVRPIAAKPCFSFEETRATILDGLAKRKTGSSSVHEESSRTHAVVELEVVNKTLLEARDAVIERESELVPVGKRATDIYLEEQMASLIRNSDGTYMPNPECPPNQTRIDAAEAEKKLYQDRLVAAEEAVVACFATTRHACLGGKFVFVDLAGSEYFDQNQQASTAPRQTMQEQKQGRQINTDLFALKEVIRARAQNQSRIPYRASPLTMVLRSHFEARGTSQEKPSRSAMILTVSSEEAMMAATRNTLKYGGLVGLAGGE
ncbi:kinesin-like protein [Cucurbitaria berberidis CBS 394.84]|uniref:Kinesin-like protein n=1 Tax=Cucurbitaria berberidis CBS 394.84 TaxID=1168544 RepID=A0A9P4GH79_9PLEO|nr:kinesin-like protein [Cucurbitaria berberidis CBS 394.84]KAF1846073.1 kinesin-like protein [Cucurbitaria berberidis CBS 394.84]